MASVRIDEGRWPIVVVTTLGVPRDEEYAAYRRRLDEILTRGEPYVIVYDLSHAGVMPRHQRDLQAEWIRRNAPRMSRILRGVAFFEPSPLMRIVLQAIRLFQPMPYPWKVTSTLAEALEWAAGRMAADAERPRPT